MTTDTSQTNKSGLNEYLTVRIANQLFGLPVTEIQEIIGHQSITHIPLAPPQVAGSLNLRGRIVTAIDVRVLIGHTANSEYQETTSVVVERHGDIYSLMVDAIGEVTELDDSAIEPFPPTVLPAIREIAQGIYQLPEDLLIIADIDTLLGVQRLSAA
jgi:purine-binding chemotaxis protein CheW